MTIKISGRRRPPEGVSCAGNLADTPDNVIKPVPVPSMAQGQGQDLVGGLVQTSLKPCEGRIPSTALIPGRLAWIDNMIKIEESK